LEHSEAVHLAKKHVAIAIDGETAETVAVGVDETIGVGLRIERAELAPQGDGATDRRLEILLADRLGRNGRPTRS